MKTEISRYSHDQEKNYSGVYHQQGRMILDSPQGARLVIRNWPESAIKRFVRPYKLSRVYKVSIRNRKPYFLRKDRLEGLLLTSKREYAADDTNPPHYIYVVRTTDEGSIRIGFGDGVHGRIPPTGTRRVRTAYRYGAGVSGNLGSMDKKKPIIICVEVWEREVTPLAEELLEPALNGTPQKKDENDDS